MKICVAQTKAVTGNVNKNIDNHKRFAERAAARGSEMIIFPELSLTGYQPNLAHELATDKDDERFNELQQFSDSKTITIGAGMPIRTEKGILIGMIIFQPDQPRQVYAKQYLHPDEVPYFRNGLYEPVLNENKIALAICYEISVPGHAEHAYKNETEIYIASVAKTDDGMNRAIDTLSATAKKYSMQVLLANCVGECEGKKAGGRSSVWSNKGSLLDQLNDRDEGIIVFDTNNQEVSKEQNRYSVSG